MKILAIGNSFSQDATRYLREIAKSNGDSVKAINLYIGACPLRKHYLHILQNKELHEIQVDGEGTGFYTSIQKALASDRWDVVTLQQGSKNSFEYKNFEPYLDLIVKTVKTYSPEAKLYVHQTWAYENGSSVMSELTPYTTNKEMYKDVRLCYEKMKEQVKADGMIRSGDLIAKMLDNGLKVYLDDGLHMSKGLGRYAIALLWYATLTGKDVSEISFNNFDEEVKSEDISTVKNLIKELLSKEN